MPIEKINEYGVIEIDNHVLSTIAGISAMESYGIVGMASKDATDGLFEILRWDNLSRGVKVSTEETENGTEIDIDLHVILEYGVKISVVAENIIDRVKFNLENLTGLEINNVNVHVEGIRVGK